MKKTIYFLAACCIMQTTIHAQSTWNLAGNGNATATSKIGTKNAIPLRLTTNNSTRVYINATTGNIGIGTGDAADAGYKLKVAGGAYGISGTGTTYGVFGSGDFGVYGTGTTHGLYGYTISDGGEGVTGYSYNGYGVNGTSGYTGVRGDGGVYGIYGISDTYGVYGNGANTGVYGISSTTGVYGDGYSYGVYGNSTNGNGMRGYSINADGAYFYSTNAYGIRAGTTNGFYAGVFDGAVYSFGGYYSSSDRNLKKNIQDFGNAMSIINKLKPKNYEFSTDEKFTSLNLPKGTHYGLIAQELEEVLPGLVKESAQEIGKPDEAIQPIQDDGKAPAAATEKKVTKVQPAKKEIMNIKGVNYEELIPILIKGMQELSKQNEDLQKQVNEMKAAPSASAQSSQKISLTDASLEQNTPNPFHHTTTIPYTLPQQYSTAKIIVTDNTGRNIKEVIVSGSGGGSVNINTSALASGTYHYSLYIDSKLISTKQMVLSK